MTAAAPLPSPPMPKVRELREELLPLFEEFVTRSEMAGEEPGNMGDN